MIHYLDNDGDLIVESEDYPECGDCAYIEQEELIQLFSNAGYSITIEKITDV